MTTQDYPDWSPPAEQMLEADYGVTQQIAALIATGSPTGSPGGVPLLNGAKQAYIQQNHVVPSGLFSSPIVPLTAPGYFAHFEALANAASTNPFFGIEMRWLDPTANFIMGSEKWVIPASSVAAGAVVVGKGPIKGTQLEVLIDNFDPVNTMTIQALVLETTQYIARDDWRSIVHGSIPGFTIRNSDEPSLILVQQSALTFSAGVSRTVLMPLYAGQVAIDVTLSAAENVLVEVLAVDPVIGSDTLVFSNVSSALNQGPFIATLPRTPCKLVLTNNGAAATDITCGVVAVELAS